VENIKEISLSSADKKERRQRYFNNIKRDVKKDLQAYLLTLPFIFFFILFVVLPIVAAIVLSFTYYNILQSPIWVGLQQYERLFLDDDVFMIAIQNTIIFAFVTGPLSYLLCFIFAWFINELPPRIRAFLTLVFYAPSISGNVFFIWTFLFSGDAYGFINGNLIKLGIINEPIQFLTDPTINLRIIIMVQLWLSLGTSFLAFIAGLQGVDKSLYEAGVMDGIRNRWQELWFITLPSMKPQLLFGAVMQIAASFSVSHVAMALAGFPSTNYSARTIVTHIIDHGNVRFEMGYASAISVILFLAMIFTRHWIGKILDYVGS
jgi:multiple sugar transport system permease protein